MLRTAFLRNSRGLDCYIDYISDNFGELFSQRNVLNLSEVIRDNGCLATYSFLFIEHEENEVLYDLLEDLCNKSLQICLFVNLRSINDIWQVRLKELIARNKNTVIGLIDTSLDPGFSFSLLSLIKDITNLKHASDSIVKVGKNINELVGSSLEELQRVKKLHEQLVPFRYEKIKGLECVSKYSAGESSGGEFFDVAKGDNEILILLAATNSYLASSSVISHFEVIREKKNFSREFLGDFVKNLWVDVRQYAVNDQVNGLLDLTLAKIDLKTLNVYGYNFGGNIIVSSGTKFVGENNYLANETFFDKSFFEFRLNRDEKLAIVSSGVTKNSEGLLNNESVVKFIKSNLDKDAKILLNEVFFHLKRRISGAFLKYDSSVIHIGVDSNAIIQI